MESTFHYESHHSPQWKWTQDYDVLRCPHFGKCDQFQILSRNLPPAKCHKPLCHQHSTVILIFVNFRPLCLDECSSLLIGICIWKATQASSFSQNTVSHQQDPYRNAIPKDVTCSSPCWPIIHVLASYQPSYHTVMDYRYPQVARSKTYHYWHPQQWKFSDKFLLLILLVVKIDGNSRYLYFQKSKQCPMWYHYFSLSKSYLRIIYYSMTQNWILKQKKWMFYDWQLRPATTNYWSSDIFLTAVMKKELCLTRFIPWTYWLLYDSHNF